MKKINVIGINTDVGKTLFSAILAESLEGFYWKAVQCGEERDSAWIGSVLSDPSRNLGQGLDFKTPCSPHLAAKKENQTIDISSIIPPKIASPLIIEGTGGILTPLNEQAYWIDAALQWKADWILVHRHYLGSFNHFHLTLEALQKRNIFLKGIFFNGEAEEEVEQSLLHKAQCPSLGRLPSESKISHQFIQNKAQEWKKHLRKALGL